MADDINKNSLNHKKKYAKYIRLIQDAEASINARDGAIRDYAEKINLNTDEGFFNRSLTKVTILPAPSSKLHTYYRF